LPRHAPQSLRGRNLSNSEKNDIAGRAMAEISIGTTSVRRAEKPSLQPRSVTNNESWPKTIELSAHEPSPIARFFGFVVRYDLNDHRAGA
jgi:hypothetical protein